MGVCACRGLQIDHQFNLDTLETQFVALYKRVEDLESKNFVNERRIETLEHSVQSLKTEMSERDRLWLTKLNKLKSESKNKIQQQILSKLNALPEKEHLHKSDNIEDNSADDEKVAKKADQRRITGMVENKTSIKQTKKGNIQAYEYINLFYFNHYNMR